MNTPASTVAGGAGQDEMMSALFATMVMHNTNMALIFLGQTPHPQTGQTSQDLDQAGYFIDQLEMLAVKTKGNLDKQEDAILKQSLTHLRLCFVQAVENPPKAAPAAATPATPPKAAPAAATPATPPKAAPAAAMPATPPKAAPAAAMPAAPPTDEQETPVTEPAPPGENTAEPRVA